VEQRYVGKSRWEFLREVKQHVGSKTILGSGDLFTADDCVRMLRETGIDGVTIARGAIGNPWIFQQAQAILTGQAIPPPPSLHVQRDVLLEHFRLSEQIHEERRVGILLRKFGIKYAACHPQYVDVRQSFARIRSRAEWEAVIAQWYAEDLPGVYPDPKIHQKTDSCDEG